MNDYIYNVIKSDKQGMRNLVSHIQHRIKYSEEEYYKWIYDIELEDIKELSENEFENLCIFVTYVHEACIRKSIEIPKWILDERLVMNPAYIHEWCTIFDILEAYQPMYYHNCFLPKNNFDVI